jgi:hypothetical protein
MQHTMRNLVAFAIIAFSTSFCTAQTPDSLRADSVLLSVFNTGAKYRLTPATFAPRTTGEEILTEMVEVQDTVIRFVETAGNGTTFMPPLLIEQLSDSMRLALEAQKLMRPVVTHKCEKQITADVKGKIVLMTLGTCDPSLMCLNAQRAGAKAIILIHPNNNRDSIKLTIGAFKDSLKIPCYTVRREIGERMSALMPSQVGIQKPAVMPEDAQALKSRTANNPSTTATKDAVKTVENGENTEGVAGSTVADVRSPNNLTSAKTPAKVQFNLSPNPANDMATFTFNLSKKTDISIEIMNEAGQLMLRKALKNAELGSFNFDTREWASGAYFIHLTDGKGLKVVKRLVVQH